MQRLLTWSIFSLSQVGVALWGCLRIGLNHKIFPGHPELKIGIAFAKTGAALVNWNAAIILLSMCRLALTRLRATRFGEKTVLLDMNVEIHRISGLLFLLGSLLHAIAHFFNVINLGKLHAIYWAHPTLVTGMLLMVMYMILSIPAYSRYVKNKCYEAFQYSHYLAIPSMVLLLSHGLFCFLKNSEGRCAGSTTWMFVCVPLLLALLELGWSTFRAYRFSYISKTISHPSNVIEIQIRKPNFVFVPGQYVYLRIPAVSYFQWHPFTLTSAPEEDHISVHLRLVGDWTRAVAELLYGERMPETLGIHVDGPYGCASQDFQKYDRVICIGAGIGQTPFASILKSLWYRANRPLGRVRLHSIAFVGICRSSKSFEWFNDILYAIEQSDKDHLLELKLFLTGKVSIDEMLSIASHHELGLPDPITGLRTVTSFGRPNFPVLFAEWSEQYGKCNVGVVFCGHRRLGLTIRKLCNQISQNSSTTFHYCEEHF